MQSENVEVEQWQLARLRPYKNNAKLHPPEQVEFLVRAITRYGFDVPIVVNKRGVIIKGHGRWLAAQKLNMATVPVVVKTNLSSAQEAEARIADNRVTEYGWDFEALRLELKTFEGTKGFDPSFTGFSLAQLGELAPMNVASDEPPEGEAQTAPEVVEDVAPDVPTKAITKSGDVWFMGAHRLVCGDATNEQHRAKLFQGTALGMVVTDPPYGVGVVKGFKVGADFGVAKKGKYRPIIGDDKTPDVAWLAKLAPRVIIWGGNYFAPQLPATGSWLIWDKRAGTEIVNTFADCELAWSNYGGPTRIHRQLWNGFMRTGEHTKRVHPTQKPIALLAWCLSFGEGLVGDFYAGSGSTLIACEQVGRSCMAMEIDPLYCDVIVERWQTLTGKKATRSG